MRLFEPRDSRYRRNCVVDHRWAVLGGNVGFLRDSSRWLIALLVIVVITAAVGIGTWLLCSHAWHWARADVIAATSIVVLAVVALGIAPATSWAAGDVERREVSRGVEVTRSRAKGSIKVKALGTARVDRSQAGQDIDVTQDAMPPSEAPGGQDGKRAH